MTEPEKLDLRSHDIAGEKIAELLRLFPEIRTEGGKLDFDRLKLALGETVDVGKERYGMNWPGKADCFKTIQTPSVATLRPCPEESVNFETSENLIIEGDNLEVLKLLQKSYLGKVKMIYIDPPYNTGNDFIYPDDYAESLRTYLEYTGQVDAEGKKVGTNTDTDGRFHSKWLTMLYPRLYLARNLLHNDGAIFVSIDEREFCGLRLLMNEVFGEECFVAAITVLCNPKGRSQDKYFATNHEYVVVYSKQPLPKGAFAIEKDEDQVAQEYTEEDDGGRYRLLELRNTHREFGKHNRRNLYYPFYVDPEGTVSLTPDEGMTKVLPDWDDGFEGCWTWDRDKAAKDIEFLVGQEVKGRWKIYRKSYASGAERMLKTVFLDKKYYTERGQKAFNQLFATKAKIFQSPKSPYLLADLMRTCTSGDDIILDFFAGSGTTAHAVCMLNADENTNRRFILAQLPEPCDPQSVAGKAGHATIADIAKGRVRRLIAAMTDTKAGQLAFDGSVGKVPGFRVYRLAESNFTEWDARILHDADVLEKQLELHVEHIRNGRSPDDILYELLLKSGFPLTTPVEKKTLAGKSVHSVAGGALVICLEQALTLELIRAIADAKPERVVCLDASFAANDQLKANAVQTFKTKGVTSFKTV
ncbi:putative methyltransferase [Phycisphaerae bacterium RAS1]|nr:putative methyltransferase [Phycisphaerae bacterium RAS1]